jgi:hypothetical protein
MSEYNVSKVDFRKYLTCTVFRIIQISYYPTNNSDIFYTLMNTIELNSRRSPNHYRYSNPVLRFAACRFILAGVYVYEYIRISLVSFTINSNS